MLEVSQYLTSNYIISKAGMRKSYTLVCGTVDLHSNFEDPFLEFIEIKYICSSPCLKNHYSGFRILKSDYTDLCHDVLCRSVLMLAGKLCIF
jgi:hypothetical protein